MKKLALFLVAVVATTASVLASETISPSTLTVGWGDNLSVSKGVITFSGTWSEAAQIWWDKKDCSAFETLRIEFEDAGTMHLLASVAYNDGVADTEADINDSKEANVITITLDKTGKKSVQKLMIKCENAGTVTVKGIYLLGDNEKPDVIPTTGCPEGTQVTLPATDAHKGGSSRNATWNGSTKTATWSQGWGGLYLSMANADWSAYKDLYIKFADDVPAKLIVDINGNGETAPVEVEAGNFVIIPIEGNKLADFSAVQCICFKLSVAGSITIECMTLRGDGNIDPSACPAGKEVALPAKDGYSEGDSWSASWDGATQTATWTADWGGLYLSMNNADWSAYDDLYIKFAGNVPSKVIIDINGNGNTAPVEVEEGDHAVIAIAGNSKVNFKKVECLCFKMEKAGSLGINCMTLRGGTTDVEQVTAQPSAVQKVIDNGQLLLIIDGVRYNAQGQIVK